MSRYVCTYGPHTPTTPHHTPHNSFLPTPYSPAPQLFTLFNAAGFLPTEASVVIGRNGRSRGYGLVTFGDEASAAAATLALHDTEFMTRNVIVHADRGSTKGDKKDAAPNPNFTGTSIFVNNLAWATDSDALKVAFAAFNPVSATVATRADGRSRGWGTVQLSTAEDANNAVERMKGADVDGRNVEVLVDKKA